MRKPAVILLLIITGACADRRDVEFHSALVAAQEALRRGALDRALSSVDEGSKLVGPDSPHAHRLRLLHAEILITKPDMKSAAALLEAAIPDGPEFVELRARELYLRGRMQVIRGQLSDALTTLDHASGLITNASEARLDAEVLAGQVLLRLGRSEEGERRLKGAVVEAAARGDRYREVLALNNLGMGLVVRNRVDAALPWFERVLKFDDLAETSVYAMAMSNAGLCYARLGHLDRALAIQSRAVDLHRRGGAATPFEQALGELGSTYLLHHDLPRAVQHLTEALEVATKAGLLNDAAIWARNLAGAYTQAGRWDEAEQANTAARRLTTAEDAPRLVFNKLHEANIAAGRGQYETASRLYTALTRVVDVPSVRWAAHEGMATLAMHRHDVRAAGAHLVQALAIIEQTRSDLLRADDRLSFVTRLTRFYQKYVDLLVDQGDIERALSVADSSRGRVLAERHGVAPPPASTVSSFRRIAAESSTVLISYWLGAERSYAWVVGPRAVRLHQLPAAAYIEGLVRKHQEAIHSAVADPLAADGAGEELRRLIVAPLLEGLKPGAGIVIVPDGALHGLNFETLPASGTPRRYWIEEVELQVAPSLALLRRRLRPVNERSLLVIGDPTPREPEFPALRYAPTEMTRIVRHFGTERSRTFEGERASPQNFRAARPEQFSLMHFTAHAMANRESPLDSAVILSGPDDGYKLYARDVAELPMRAELVTVSACRSAGERVYSGEGLVGFAWAFLRAGAHRVIAGLWDVDDRSTAELMDVMYARLAAGDSPPRALRTAKLALLAKGGVTAKPYYWAPFQVFTVTPN